MAKTFRGQTVRLATHAIGARVVQTALDSLPVASAALIKVSFGVGIDVAVGAGGAARGCGRRASGVAAVGVE